MLLKTNRTLMIIHVILAKFSSLYFYIIKIYATTTRDGSKVQYFVMPKLVQGVDRTEITLNRHVLSIYKISN